MQKIGRWFRDNSLWIVGLGLMLASSGLDGVYMATWMPPGYGWLGLVLNTTSDVSGMVIIYWYGRLRQDRSSRKRRLSAVLLAAEAVTVLYSWAFSWRQLRLVLPAIEGEASTWVSALAAGFIPLLLAFIGYAQALLAGRLEDREKTSTERQPAAPAEKAKATIADWREILPSLDGNERELSAEDIKTILTRRGFAAPSRRTRSAWARLARQEGE